MSDFELKSPPEALNEHDLYAPGPVAMSTAKGKDVDPPTDSANPKHSMLQGGRVSTSGPALRRDNKVFAPSPLAHAEAAPLSSPHFRKDDEQETAVATSASPTNVNDKHITEELDDLISVGYQLLRETQATSSLVEADRIDPSASAFSEEPLFFPQVDDNTSSCLSSPLKETMLNAPEQSEDDYGKTPGEPTFGPSYNHLPEPPTFGLRRKVSSSPSTTSEDENEIETPSEPTFGPLRKISSAPPAPSEVEGEIRTSGEPTFPLGHPLRNVSTASDSRPGQTALNPPGRKEIATKALRRHVFIQGTPKRQIPSLSSAPSVTYPSNRKRQGPPVSLYEEAFLRIVDEVADNEEPSRDATPPPQPPRFSFNPIGELVPLPAPSPLPVKPARKKRVTEPEDPFEGFNSGSEKDAESDADFDEGDTVSEVSGEEDDGIASEDDQGENVPVANKARKRKERGDDSGSEAERTPRPRVMKTDFPTANKAFKHRKEIGDDDEGMAVGFLGGDLRASGGDKMKVQDMSERNGKDWSLVVSKVRGKKVVEWKIVKWTGWGKIQY
ncbi:MAG: hypothetical protein L6R41_000879 [Letrouitia leprolyta]|nr:MAG: hypothetical protein L6R41_000879 [Letrouitia leprolyta]